MLKLTSITDLYEKEYKRYFTERRVQKCIILRKSILVTLKRVRLLTLPWGRVIFCINHGDYDTCSVNYNNHLLADDFTLKSIRNLRWDKGSEYSRRNPSE